MFRFLVFRRCLMLATMFGQMGQEKGDGFHFAAFLVLVGSVAGSGSFDTDAIGFILIWGFNISRSLFDVDCIRMNKEKSVTAFDINFCFALVAFAYSAVMSLVFSNEYSLLVKKMSEMDSSFLF